MDGADGGGSQGKAGKSEQTDREVDLLSHRVIFELPVSGRFEGASRLRALVYSRMYE